MRLIQNKKVSDSLLNYYKTINEAQYLFSALFEMKKGLANELPQLFISTDYDKVTDRADKIIHPAGSLFLRSTDKEARHTSF
jgi:hypothetical protein